MSVARQDSRQLTVAAREEARRAVLAQLAEGRTLEEAAKAAGISRKLLYTWRRDDEAFAQQVADAVEAGTDVFRAELRRRAVEGVEEPVYQGGQLVGHIRKYSDNLLMFAIKQRDPSYRDSHRVELTGQAGAPIPVEVNGGRVTALADVLELARQLGVGLGAGVAAGVRDRLSTGPARDALPAAPNVLPDPADG